MTPFKTKIGKDFSSKVIEKGPKSLREVLKLQLRFGWDSDLPQKLNTKIARRDQTIVMTVKESSLNKLI